VPKVANPKGAASRAAPKAPRASGKQQQKLSGAAGVVAATTAAAATLLGKRPATPCTGTPAFAVGQPPSATAPTVAQDDASKAKAARVRRKASDVTTEAAEQVVRQAQEQGTFAKVGLAELKAFLKSRGKPVGGKKADVVERAQEALRAAA
jgi:SAP domain